MFARHYGQGLGVGGVLPMSFAEFAAAGREEHRIEREDKREREQERLERLGDTDSISNAAATTPAESAGGP